MNFEIRKTSAWFPDPHFMSYVTLSKLCGRFPHFYCQGQKDQWQVPLWRLNVRMSLNYISVSGKQVTLITDIICIILVKCFCVWHSSFISFMSILYSQNPLGIQKWVSRLWREMLQLCEEPLKGSNFTDLAICYLGIYPEAISKDLVKNL